LFEVNGQPVQAAAPGKARGGWSPKLIDTLFRLAPAAPMGGRRSFWDAATAPDGLDRQGGHNHASAWQVLETRVDEAFGTSPGEDVRPRQFWGPRYVDEAVMRRSKSRSSGQGDAAFSAAV
jgi:hypothetical protein